MILKYTIVLRVSTRAASYTNSRYDTYLQRQMTTITRTISNKSSKMETTAIAASTPATVFIFYLFIHSFIHSFIIIFTKILICLFVHIIIYLSTYLLFIYYLT